MIPETFNSTVSYSYLTKWSLELLLPTLIGVFIGAFLAIRLEERSRHKRELFIRLNEKIYEPWMSELEERYEFRLITFDLDRSEPEPKVGHTFHHFGFINEPKKYLIEEIEGIFRGKERLIKLKYVRKTNILKEWEDFKKDFSDYEKECASFFKKIEQRASERAQLPFYANPKLIKDNKCIGPSFIEHIYNKLVLKESGEEKLFYKESSWYKGIEPSIERIDSGIYELRCVEPSLSKYSYFYAQGSEEEMKKCKDIFVELVNYPEYITKAESLINQAKEIEEEIKSLRDKIGEIMDLGKL